MKQQFPAFLTFIVTDLDGQPFCDTNSDRRPVSVASRAYFANAVRTGAFSVGEYSIGLSVHRKVIQFALPFYGDDGRMGGVIIAPLGLDWLADHLAQKDVPAGGALAIIDRNGTYLASYPDNGQFIGRKLPAGSDLKLDHGIAKDVVDLDGVERIVSFSTLAADSGGLLVSAGLDKAQAFTEIRERTQRGIFLIVLSTSLVLVLTVLGARRFIQRPLGQLVHAANQWQLGEYAQRANIRDRSEISRVADAFNTMADALERREQELSEAKEKAEKAAARISMIVESTTDSVVVVDRDWRISFFNQRAWAQIADGRDLMGMDLQESVLKGKNSEIINQFREAMSNQRPASFETYCARRDAWYALNAFPFSEGLAVFFRDITEHKLAVEARRVTEEQLHQSQKMESVGQLTGGVAHDFNNLLTVVTGNLELIEDATDIAKVRHFAVAARRAADRGARLTAQLLAFSRRQKLHPKLVNANDLISEFQGLIGQAVGGGCEFRLRTSEGLGRALIDPPC